MAAVLPSASCRLRFPVQFPDSMRTGRRRLACIRVIVVCRIDPPERHHFFDGQFLQPADPPLQILAALLTREPLAIRALAREPEIRRRTERALELKGSRPRNRGLPLDDFVNGFYRPLQTARELR